MDVYRLLKLEAAVILMSNIFNGHSYTLIAGDPIETCLKSHTFIAFDPNVIQFFDQISSKCLPLCRSPELNKFASFFFACRSRNLFRLSSDFPSACVGRGLSLNIAPSNVPLNAFYTLMFTLLSGSPCILRISESVYNNLSFFLDHVSELYNSFIGKIPSFSIITYPRSSELTQVLSSYSASRVVWGGDSTVNSICQLPSSPSCVDIVFPNRVSCAVVNLDDLWDSADVDLLFKSFVLDFTQFGQQACSSPKHIYFVSSNLDLKLVERFFSHLDSLASSLADLEFTSRESFVSSLRHHLSSPSLTLFYSGAFVKAFVDKSLETDPHSNFRENGIFSFTVSSSLANIQLAHHYQTVVALPFPSDDDRNYFFKKYFAYFDRLVRPGQAIDMHTFWDGYDIVRSLSRKVFY